MCHPTRMAQRLESFGQETQTLQALHEAKEYNALCDLCKGDVVGVGHNPSPLDGDTACDDCNFKLVMPARGKSLKERIILSKPDVDPRWAEAKNENKLKPDCDWCCGDCTACMKGLRCDLVGKCDGNNNWCGECTACMEELRCECRRPCCDVQGGTCEWQMARYEADEDWAGECDGNNNWCGDCTACMEELRCECRRPCCDVQGGTCEWQMARYEADESAPEPEEKNEVSDDDGTDSSK